MRFKWPKHRMSEPRSSRSRRTSYDAPRFHPIHRAFKCPALGTSAKLVSGCFSSMPRIGKGIDGLLRTARAATTIRIKAGSIFTCC
jgi:hypothetical protein